MTQDNKVTQNLLEHVSALESRIRQLETENYESTCLVTAMNTGLLKLVNRVNSLISDYQNDRAEVARLKSFKDEFDKLRKIVADLDQCQTGMNRRLQEWEDALNAEHYPGVPDTDEECTFDPDPAGLFTVSEEDVRERHDADGNGALPDVHGHHIEKWSDQGD